MQANSNRRTTASIRQFLTESFSDEELATLCFDYFRDVYDDFASGMTKGQKIQLLIERCERRGILPNLLAAIQRARPEQYKEQFPQIEIQPESPRLGRDLRQVFISHAHQDANFAHRLAKDLQGRGWQVWIAPDSIRPGEKWGEAIDRGLGESGIFIAVLSPAAVQSRWVKNETYVAIELESKGHLRFVPLDVEHCDVPGLWSVYQRVSFLGGYADGLKALLADLEQTGRLPSEKLAASPEPPQAAGAANAFGKIDQQISGLARVQATEGRTPSQGPTVLSAYLLRMKRNPLPFLLGGAGVVALAVVLVIMAVSSGKGQATPTPLAVLRPTLTPATTFSLLAQPTNVPASATPMARPAATPSIGSTLISEKDGMVMVYVPAGEFLMGSADSDAQAQGDEKPQHQVYLDAFWIDKTEATNAMFAHFVAATGYKTDAEKIGQGWTLTGSQWGNVKGADWQHPHGPDTNISGLDNHPAEMVSWNDAQAYCQWAGRRLPTEAQWEKAARGTDGRVYPWGNQTATCDYAVMSEEKHGCGQEAAGPVGSRPKGASLYGALDMAGNVEEWVADWYDTGYYASLPSTNPQGPSSGQERIVRGGAWSSDLTDVRVARLDRATPESRVLGFGFRCAVMPGEPAPSAAPPVATPGIGPTRVSEKDGMTLMYVPVGEFRMGSVDLDPLADKDEKPQHTVYLDAFWIDRTEVTNAQYEKCVQAAACLDSNYANDSRYNGETQPVVGVDWNKAQAYCQWAGRALPTEAQWEKAARGTDGRIYPWSNQTATCNYAVMADGNGKGCGKGDAAWSVGSKLKGASPYGVLDMAGNVWEWVADWYDGNYYASSPSKNPPGPLSGQKRVLRGGSLVNDAQYMRSAARGNDDPVGFGVADWGFRCACVSSFNSGC